MPKSVAGRFQILSHLVSWYPRHISTNKTEMSLHRDWATVDVIFSLRGAAFKAIESISSHLALRFSYWQPLRVSGRCHKTCFAIPRFPHSTIFPCQGRLGSGSYSVVHLAFDRKDRSFFFFFWQRSGVPSWRYGCWNARALFCRMLVPGESTGSSEIRVAKCWEDRRQEEFCFCSGRRNKAFRS